MVSRTWAVLHQEGGVRSCLPGGDWPELSPHTPGCAHRGGGARGSGSSSVPSRAGLLSRGSAVLSLSGTSLTTGREKSQPWPCFHSPWGVTNAANRLPAEHLAHLWGQESQLEGHLGGQRWSVCCGPGHDPGVPGLSPPSGSLHGACFSLCLCLCLSLSLCESRE